MVAQVLEDLAAATCAPRSWVRDDDGGGEKGYLGKDSRLIMCRVNAIVLYSSISNVPTESEAHRCCIGGQCNIVTWRS